MYPYYDTDWSVLPPEANRRYVIEVFKYLNSIKAHRRQVQN